MPKYKIEQDRIQCIGCGSCAAMCPEIWVMREDGKAGLTGGKKDDELETMIIDESQFKKAKEAADSCPVNAAKITQVK